jgi:signal transduction histidine kinase
MVCDDGQGFAVPDGPAEMAPSGHSGLSGVQERAGAVGARLRIKSAHGTGTRLVVSLKPR